MICLNIMYFSLECVCILYGFCCFYREAGFPNIAQRLIEVQFELTDRLTYYLCGRRPGNDCFLELLVFIFCGIDFCISWHIPLTQYGFNQWLALWETKFVTLISDHQNGVHYLIPTMADRSHIFFISFSLTCNGQ